MTHLLKHIASRIWTVAVIGGLVCMVILPWVQRFTGIAWVPIWTAVILISIFLIVDNLANRYGSKTVATYIAEAGTWERAGQAIEAEKSYRHAIAVFDSFLFSPKARKKQSAFLLSQLARFYLARVEKNPISEAFIISYLEAHPEDSEIAEIWLRQISTLTILPDPVQALVLQVGEAQKDNKKVQRLLAQLYLAESRTDFQALQIYSRVLEQNEDQRNDLMAKLSAIFLKEGRVDEWALNLYLQAYQSDRTRTRFLNGIAACVHWLPENLENKKQLQLARKLLADLDEAKQAAMRSGFKPPVRFKTEVHAPARKSRFGLMIRNVVKRVPVIVALFVRSIVSITIELTIDLFRVLRTSYKYRHFLKWILISAMTAVVLVLFVNTMGHLLSSKPEERKRKIEAVVVTDPFTIQVAAYIKPEHAKRYVEILKQKKLDAYWMEAIDKKKKWYQVRISHFPDKQSAIAYGNSLKTKGLIDDFYVANYERP